MTISNSVEGTQFGKDSLDRLSPGEQTEHLKMLLDTMAPDAALAMMEVVLWLTTERARGLPVTQALIVAWVEDVRRKHRREAQVQSAVVHSFPLNPAPRA